MRESVLLPAIALVFLALWAAPASGQDSIDPFPDLEILRPNVDFWTRVFGEWTLSHVAIHDLEHPELVYEVIDLPGKIEEYYTSEQKDYVEGLRLSWEHYLANLERKISRRQPLDDVEKQWALYIVNLLGSNGLEGAHARVRSQRGLRERFLAGLARSPRYDAAMREIFREAGLPEDLAFLPHVESSFQYGAKSSAGATGIWQFTRSTGRQYMTINSAIDERLDPIVATRAAAAYLTEAYAKLEDWPFALTSYNHGIHGMGRAKKKHGDFETVYAKYKGRTFGFASKNFYAEFLAARRIATDPDTYFPEGFKPERPHDLDLVLLESRLTPGLIAKQYGIPVIRLVELNPAWSARAVRSPLKLPVGTRVWLPAGTIQPPQVEIALSTDALIYVVQPGDTLTSIAQDHGLPLSTLRAINEMPPGSSLIRVGQQLTVGRSTD